MTEKAIVCVDDEAIILESLKEQLKRRFGNQYLYEMAESVEEAWEIIEELKEEDIEILMIISDWLMPEIKGDEFLIKVHEKYPQIVTVMLTGQADGLAVKRAQDSANLYSCLYKPWSEKDLVDIISSALK
ncbi:response regulator [Lyngbya sp. PCC 8106]|uniref:response regulator n=1 Tax=Lyngbya sp. (strain PCC 8106) TaxID=313612 RepID=UPI0000EAA3A7|nr:response regulator [Lyngbya sp. PCC 8106]EAW35412.1 two-component response regulator [Lyngbya sp. PCC 8106]